MNLDINSDIIKNDPTYQEFLKNNPGRGFLKIRATSASEALPVSGMRIVVSKVIGANNVIFFDGETDSSGMINGITLPTSPKITNNLEPPEFTEYNLVATYELENFKKIYTISLCCSVSVIQNINVTPNIYDGGGE